MTTLRILALLIPFLLTSCEAIAGEILPIAFASFAKDDLYRSGQKALDERRWNEAASIFGKVAERGGSDADAGLYWRAYAQHKAGRSSESLATIRRLASTYPKSAWLDDARALEVEVRGDQGVLVQPSAEEDEDLKLYALGGLMDNHPEKALPLVRQYLRGKHSLENKEKALFLLTQSDLPEARQALLEIVRGTAHPELRMQAIEYLGSVAEDDPSVLPVLDELYHSSQDRRIREVVIEAYGNAELVAKLRSLLQSETDPKARRMILRALGNAGDVDSLIAAARGEKDPEARIEAIHSLGDEESAKATEALRSLYTGGADRKIRMAVIDAFSNQENAKALIELFRAEKDRELRREIIQRLADMDTPEAQAFIDKIFDQE
jgi:HEAT repeats